MKNSLKKRFMVIFTLGVFVLLLGTSPVKAVSTTEFISTTYDRQTVDRVDVTIVGNFTLENNYTLLKIYYAIWPTETDSGSAVATKTVDYSTYNNATSGDSGEVQVSTIVIAYDGNAQDVNIFGGDKVYIRFYIYNASVSSANLIVKSSFDLDYWPLGGRYTAPATETTTEDSGTSWTTWAIYAGSGIVIFVAALAFIKYGGKFLSGPKRDTLQYKDGRKAWAVRNKDGSFKDIQDPGRAMTRDRATPHRYNTGADRRPRSK